MEQLWAPWRGEYVTAIIDKVKGCVFCRIEKEAADKHNFVVFRSRHTYAVLNIYPYNPGHVLIVPNRHVKDLSRLSGDEKADLWGCVETVQALLDQVLQPHGYNIGMNLGRVAGAGFPSHLHIHIVPRWKGDANFMSVVAQTRVISDSLKALHKKMSDAYKTKH